MSRATEPRQSEPDKPGRLNASRRPVGQDLRNLQESPFGSAWPGDEAARVGVGQRCPGRAVGLDPGSWVLWAHVLGARVPLPVPYPCTPLPASCFCFGATGTSSSHHSSKWLAGLRGRPSVGGRVIPAQGTSTEGRAGGLCPREAVGPPRCELWYFPQRSCWSP